MRYFLITANPVKQGFKPITEAEDIKNYLDCIRQWEDWTVKSKAIKPEDGFFLMLLGQDKYRGIIAAGEFLTGAVETDEGRYAGIKLVPCRYVELKELKSACPDQLWTPQSSGISIRAKYTDWLTARTGFTKIRTDE